MEENAQTPTPEQPADVGALVWMLALLGIGFAMGFICAVSVLAAGSM